MDPNYYPPNYVPEEEDVPLLIDNLVTQPENAPKEEEGEENVGEEADKGEDRRKDSIKTKADSGQEADEEEESYSEYSTSDLIY